MKPVLVFGVEVPVSVVDEDDDPEFDTCHAYYSPNECTMAISAAGTQAVRWHRFCHEFCHTGNDLLSVEYQLRRMGLTPEQAAQVEEYMAELFPLHVANLEANGWIKRPLIK